VKGMGFIFAAIVIAVIAEIFILKLYKDGGRQLSKYDKDHSVVRMSNSDELSSVISGLSNSGAENIEVQGNDVKLNLKKNKYTINVENGIASVKYDMSGTEVKFSAIGRILKPFRYSKSAKKAVIINSLFDEILGKKDSNDKKEYNKVKKDSTLIWISLVAMLICFVIGISNMTVNGLSEEAITKVKNTEYFNDVTYETLINDFIEEPEWEALISNDDNTAVIEVSGTSVTNEQLRIQFLGSSGMGYDDISKQAFYLCYFEADGVSVDPETAMEFIYEYLGY
jgi:hypothetical protein